jgi:hypothetical protein
MIEGSITSPLLTPERPELLLSQYATLLSIVLHGLEPVIQYEGQSVIFNRPKMKVGEPHIFAFAGENRVAVKRSDETIDVYYLP